MAEPTGSPQAAALAEAVPARPTRFERRMSDTEALMWMAERDPLLRSAFETVTLLDAAPEHIRVGLGHLEAGHGRSPAKLETASI